MALLNNISGSGTLSVNAAVLDAGQATFLITGMLTPTLVAASATFQGSGTVLSNPGFYRTVNRRYIAAGRKRERTLSRGPQR